MGVSGGAVTTLMIGTMVAKGWDTGVGTGGRGGEGGGAIVGTIPTGIGRGEGEEAMTAVGMAAGIEGDGEGSAAKKTVEAGGVTLGWVGRSKKKKPKGQERTG